jgi:protein-disulfide isomerase
MAVANWSLILVILALLLWPSGPLMGRYERWHAERQLRKHVVQAWPEISEAGATLYAGRPDSRKVVIFSDYQCPFCRSLDQSIERLIADSAKIAIVFRHFPLSIHPFAEEAARAAVCAQAQGRVRSMHLALFSTSAWQTDGRLANLMALAGVKDSAAFNSCISSDSSLSVVHRDVELAQRLGFDGTPVIVSRSNVHVGRMSAEQLLRFASH